MQEQERRLDSFVLGDFQTDRTEIMNEKFTGVCLALDVGEDDLSGLVRSGETSMFRAKILDHDQRRFLLDCARNL